MNFPFRGLVFLFSLMAASAAFSESSLSNPTAELGYQNSFLLGSDSNRAVGSNPTLLTRSLFYFQPAWAPSFRIGDRTFETQMKVRAWLDTIPGGFQSEFSLRNFSVSTAQSQWRLVAGFQEIVWGETFGFPVLDLVSPRDFRDPLLLDANWVRLPTASLNAQYFYGQTTVQLVITPFARSPVFPNSGSPVDPTLGTPGVSLRNTSGTDLGGIAGAEFGGKLSHLFSNGMDVGLIYFHHWNRNPVFRISPTSPPGTFLVLPTEQKVETLGFTFSASFDSWVIRSDQAVHLNQPLQTGTLGTVSNGAQWQNVLGADYTGTDEWSLGIQLQTTLQIWDGGTLAQKWASGRMTKKWFDGKVEAELFVLSGLDNPDLWLQPKLTWNWGDSWSLALRADWIAYKGGAPSRGNLWIVRDQSRLLSWLTYKL
ncbi:MAG: hypothetical protein HYX41_00070 [Bdellovibrio sp.]|nr:hypothetical protein [Bdellovibrio sp.]